jgi:hypothetical protein
MRAALLAVGAAGQLIAGRAADRILWAARLGGLAALLVLMAAGRQLGGFAGIALDDAEFLADAAAPALDLAEVAVLLRLEMPSAQRPFAPILGRAGLVRGRREVPASEQRAGNANH